MTDHTLPAEELHNFLPQGKSSHTYVHVDDPHEQCEQKVKCADKAKHSPRRRKWAKSITGTGGHDRRSAAFLSSFSIVPSNAYVWVHFSFWRSMRRNIRTNAQFREILDCKLTGRSDAQQTAPGDDYERTSLRLYGIFSYICKSKTSFCVERIRIFICLCYASADPLCFGCVRLSFGAHFKDGDGGQFGKVRVKTWHSWKLRRQIIKSLFAIFLMSSNVALVI